MACRLSAAFMYCSLKSLACANRAATGTRLVTAPLIMQNHSNKSSRRPAALKGRPAPKSSASCTPPPMSCGSCEGSILIGSARRDSNILPLLLLCRCQLCAELCVLLLLRLRASAKVNQLVLLLCDRRREPLQPLHHLQHLRLCGCSRHRVWGGCGQRGENEGRRGRSVEEGGGQRFAVGGNHSSLAWSHGGIYSCHTCNNQSNGS